MNRSTAVGLTWCAAFTTACGGGAAAAAGGGGDFYVLRTSPVDNGGAFLNDPIRIDFSQPVDLGTASLDSVAFHVFDQVGNPVGDAVTGSFQLGRSAGDDAPGRQLVFAPHFPTDNAFANGGLRAGRSYIVRLVGGDPHNGATLRSALGTPLRSPASLRFVTAEGTQPAQLFRNPGPGGPRRLPVGGFLVATAADLDAVPLNLLGGPPVEVRLRFDQALNPHDANVPVHLDTNPLVRSIAQRGRIFLEYDDPVLGANTWLPADVELERNDLDGATVVLRPVGVLPNNAEIRAIVESSVEDIAGESNEGEPAYDRVFGRFRTASAYGQQFNAVVERFVAAESVDFGAVFPEPLADVGPGWVQASFSFEGGSTSLDYEPAVSEVVLNTSFTQVVPRSGLPFNVSGGVFQFRNVYIPPGVSVRGQGPKPMVWLCSGDVRVEGELSVRGGDAERVTTAGSAHYPKAAGIGVCGGGTGGLGSPSSTLRDLFGGDGYGPGMVPGLGGRGGRLSCIQGCYTGDGGGSGGGGGTLATQGDPYYQAPPTSGTAFQQRLGIGGAGCSGGSGTRVMALAGGAPGPPVFTDGRADNDFWGAGVDFHRNLRVTGEMQVPVGGGGGGGGGDHASSFGCNPGDPFYSFDASGAGGGGGGGVLIVKALGEIVVAATGRIVADGGHGGGGEWLGGCDQGGGGGGAAGGMVVLMSSKRIVLHTHGSATRWTYGQNDYDFVVSADGGVGGANSNANSTKYPASGQAMALGSTYDANPRGGLGGLGIVQLMAPPGDNDDGTNTRLDDNVVVYRNNALQSGAAKRQILAWRGFPNAAGVPVDDGGVPTAIGNNEGDIRPAPILLPVPFAARSRLRSKWIDTGRSQRRPLAAPDGLPRGLVVGGEAVAGPVFEFAGLQVAGPTAGYLAYEPIGLAGVRFVQPLVVDATAVAAIDGAATHLGQPAYAVDLAAPALGAVADRHRHHEAELLDGAGLVAGGFRILAHDAARLWLAPDGKALPAAVARLQVRAKFFAVSTQGVDGLGPVYVPAGSPAPVPQANLRIGFAFHRDPAAGSAGRYPLDPQAFVHDLAEPGFVAWIQQNGAPRYVQWDVTFDATFSVIPSLGPSSPRPRLHWLRLPFRF